MPEEYELITDRCAVLIATEAIANTPTPAASPSETTWFIR